MSKGVIVKHIEAGKYQVSHQVAVEKIEQELVEINERIAELAVEVPENKLKLILAKDAVSAKLSEIDGLIPDLRDGVEGAHEAITKLQAEAVALHGEVRKIEFKLAGLIAEDLSLKKRRGQLNAVDSSKEIEAWCADYTEDLSGEVGIIDVNDEGGQGAIIQPGFDGQASYSPIRDGDLFPNIAQSPGQIFFNAAIMPGVQKWMPRYRIGTISNTDLDLCDVTLDDAKSSIDDLPINENAALKDVPIVYMDCNGGAFEDGDRVVVRFTQNGPLVVGFESEPKRCDLPIFIVKDQTTVLEMQADFSVIRRNLGSLSSDVVSIAVVDDKIGYVRQPGSDVTAFGVSGGPYYSFSRSTDELEVTQVSANTSGFKVIQNDENSGGSPIASVLQFSSDGNSLGQLSLGTSGLDPASYSGQSFEVDQTHIYYSLNGQLGGPLIADVYHFICDIDTGIRVGLDSLAGKRFPVVCANHKYHFVAVFTTLIRTINVFNTGGYAAVSSFQLQDNAGDYLSICASRTRFYAFKRIPEEPENMIFHGVAIVEIYSISDEGVVTFDNAINLYEQFGIQNVVSSSVDAALLFR